MRKREFDKAIRSLATKAGKGKPARLDPAKVAALPDEAKADLVRFIVRWRAPVAAPLIGPATDRGWIGACGYIYPFQGDGMAFLGLAEHALGRPALPSRAIWDDHHAS